VENLVEDDVCDFEDDLKRIKYIKRLLTKYNETGVLKTRLLLNHIVILMNTLGPLATTRILLYKINPKYHEIISTFLHELNALNGVLMKEMGIDEKVQNLIRKEMR